jgi:hypothetical protein
LIRFIRISRIADCSGFAMVASKQQYPLCGDCLVQWWIGESHCPWRNKKHFRWWRLETARRQLLWNTLYSWFVKYSSLIRHCSGEASRSFSQSQLSLQCWLEKRYYWILMGWNQMSEDLGIGIHIRNYSGRKWFTLQVNASVLSTPFFGTKRKK